MDNEQPSAPREITEADIERLRADPSKAVKFDAFFGEGASARILQPAPQEAPPQVPTEAPVEAVEAPAEAPAGEGWTVTTEAPAGLMGWLKQGLSQYAEMGGHVNEAAAEVAQGAAHGVQSAVNETLDTAESINHAVASKVDETFGTELALGTADDGFRAPEVIKEPVSGLGRTTSSITQFMAGFVGAGKLTGLKGVVGGLVNGAIADAVVFDPNDENLSSLMEGTPYALPLLTEALAVDPESPEWVNRMRRAAEGVLVGGALEGALKGFRAVALAKKGAETGDEGLKQQAVELADEAQLDAEKAMDEGIELDPPAPAQAADEASPAAATEEVAPEAPRPTLLREDALKAALADKDKITDEQLADSLWFNTEKMDGPVEAQQMIEMVGDALARSGALEKLGIDVPETFEATIKKARQEVADIIGSGLGQFTDRVAQVSEVARDQAKFLVAGKMALQSTGREIGSLARQLDAMYALGKVDPEIEAKLLDMVDTHANLQGHLKAVQTAAARATSAGRIRTTDAIDSAALSALERVGQAGGSLQVRKLAHQLRMAGENPAAQAALIRHARRGGVGKRLLSVANEVFINSILSGPKTHMVNLTSNMLNTVYLPIERAMGGALTLNPSQIRQAVEHYGAIRTATFDGLRYAGRVLRSENPILDTAVKLDYQAAGGRAIVPEAFGAAADSLGGKLISGLGHIVRLPGRLLMAEDELFKQLNFRMRLQANLAATARTIPPEKLKRMGYANPAEFITGETEKAVNSIQSLTDQWEELVLKGRVSETDDAAKDAFIRDNLGSVNEASIYAKDAMRVAREATFTSPLREGTLSHGYQQLANRHPLLRQITPFIQTPVNILNKAFDRVPGVNLMRTRYRERLVSADPAVRAEAAGEMATGVLISTALYMLTLEGRITGGGPSDPKRRAMWMQDKGWQPYSLNIGTPEEPEWVEYKRLDPYAFTFGLAGDIGEMVQAAQDDPSFDSASMFAMLAAAVGNNLTSKTWLQGIADFVEVLQSKDRPYVAQRFLEDRATSFIPFSAASRYFNQTELDEFQRDARGYIDKAKMSVIGYSPDVPVKYDWIDGQPMDKPENLLGFLRYSKSEGDPVTKELRKLNYGFSGPDRKIGEITLSTQQYQDWARFMGSVRLGGKTLKQALSAAMQTSAYDIDRQRIPDGVSAPDENPRVKMLGRIISAYKQAGRAELFEEHPDLEDAWFRLELYQKRALSGKAAPEERENLILKF